MILRLLNTAFPNDFPMGTLFIVASMALANIPDADVLWSKKLRTHHRSPLHKPLFWIALSMAGLALSSFTAFPTRDIVILLSAQTAAHLAFDYATAMTTGIQVFWPLSEREYSLFPLRPSFGGFKPLSLDWKTWKRFIRRYLQNKPRVAIEITVSILGLAVLLM